MKDQESEARANLQAGSCRQVGGDAVLPGAAIAGFGVQEAVQQPGGVQRVHHEDPEQQLGDGAAAAGEVRGLRQTPREHGDDDDDKRTMKEKERGEEKMDVVPLEVRRCSWSQTRRQHNGTHALPSRRSILPVI